MTKYLNFRPETNQEDGINERKVHGTDNEKDRDIQEITENTAKELDKTLEPIAVILSAWIA